MAKNMYEVTRIAYVKNPKYNPRDAVHKDSIFGLEIPNTSYNVEPYLEKRKVLIFDNKKEAVNYVQKNGGVIFKSIERKDGSRDDFYFTKKKNNGRVRFDVQKVD